MYRLLIADDEKNIRDGLVDFIDYAQYGVECVGTAADGAQALERVRAGEVDILLTDISMPGMDGIELLKSAVAARPGLKSIVLSGYDNFDYVREAMRSGAYTYLLKPVKRQELTEAVRAVVQQIDREAVDERYRRESMRLMRISVANRLLIGAISPQELEDRLRMLDISLWVEARYCAAVAKLSMDGAFNPRAGDSRLFAVTTAMERMEDRLGKLLCLDALGNVTVILSEPDSRQLRPELEALRRALEQAMSCRVGMVVGAPVDGLTEVRESYRSALKMLDFIYVTGVDHIIDDVEYRALARRAQRPEPLDETEVRRLAQARDVEGLQARLDAYFDALQRDPDADVNQVRVALIEFTGALSEELALASSSEGIYATRQRMLRELTQSSFVSDFSRVMRAGLARLFDDGEIRRQDGGSRFTNEVIEILEREYSDVKLSIKTIAAQIHVNPAYLGRRFYKDTGRYFSDYLNELRIRKAKELLLNPEARIQEIGEKVGYVSTSYFAQVFRQQTGVSPSKWRK